MLLIRTNTYTYTYISILYIIYIISIKKINILDKHIMIRLDSTNNVLKILKIINYF